MNFFNGDKTKFNNFKNKLKYSHTISYYIEKYGEIKGTKIFNEICSKKDSSSLQHFIKKNKGNEELALFEFRIKTNKCKQTLNSFIFRYGIDGNKKYNDYISQKSYYLSVDNFTKLYGEIDGIIRRNNWLSKIRNSNFYSNESIKIFKDVDKY